MDFLALKKKIKEFPNAPGVYIFKDGKGNIIYIGKAASLKSRVSSYFRGTNTKYSIPNTSRPIEQMIYEVADIKIQKTDSVLEALILEANLIKEKQPKYNVKEKDDKSFSYFVVTKEEFPRILIKRKTELEAFLGKETFSLPLSLRKEERRKIRNTKYEITYTKIYGPYTSKRQMQVALKIIRKIFPFHSLKKQSEKGCLDYQIGLCPGPYEGSISKKDYMKNIRSIKMILEGKKKNLMKKMEKEMQNYSKKHKYEKAAEIRNKIFALKHIQDIALISKEEKVQFVNYELRAPRIEAYDISNISGQYAVGSMVVFQGDKPDKSQYRKFKIKTVKGANDIAMMKEVLERRWKNDWIIPDLVVLDGGKGHLNIAEKIWENFGIDVPIAAVAKGPTRKIADSEVLISKEFPISKSKMYPEIKKILNNRNLVKNITDEAHRFAIQYYRKLNLKGYKSNNPSI